MADNSKKDGSTPVALSPALERMLPSGTEIYDALMSAIEPELLSANLPSLEEKYANETLRQKKEREMRYQKAFAAYDKAYKGWIADLSSAVEAKRRDAYEVAEEETKHKDEALLGDIESQFNSANFSS
ncbi:hypothetical protein COU78_06385 [Candidatus Peregrinibacteria bacterium CG10_big_fil_rev_8_21_14_0_10_49_24]|nr:MAG: hypothetical protein COV83_03215 [Candidatus Peregrinibacteria bacterium CG11_big_fil_rev_8_21_14_0_20_49_14]PIR50478.1 MAG: hypothetical protein COU78_06385 [Candidatus Peregrinibacteria bacterium CG10_big_fil_rev_8_21_14_0_10_49_24]PJA68314.1 MAG: hypothetical protein CO157_00375 [Candidatus Peregrinibacteria bacterium CG_4_9_14_3_um_filter_49_12]